MATPAHFEQSAACHPAVLELVPPPMIPYQSDGGFLESRPLVKPKLPFDLTVSDWQDLPSSYTHGVGQTETSVVTVSDNDNPRHQPSVFVFRKIIPDAQQFATSVDMMPALATRVNGYNTYIGRVLAKHGIHSRIVGTNQTRGFSLLHDTQASVVILKAEERRNALSSATCTPNTSLDLGYSMGQMKALAKQVLAPAMDWTVVLNKGIDPCVAQEIDYRDFVNVESLLYFLAEAALVPLNICHNAQATGVVKTASRLRHWAGSVGVAPWALRNTLDKWLTIATGETGSFVPLAPTDTPTVIHFFNGSKLNHGSVFEKQMAHNQFTKIITEDGRHLSAACATVVGNLATDLVAALELIEQGASKQDIVSACSRPILAKRRT